MTTNLKIAPEVQVLVKARELLVTKGWIQRAYAAENGYCMAGAIRATIHSTFFPPDDAYRGPRRFITEAIWGCAGRFRGWHDVYAWNDSHTKEEVLAVFDKAIALGMGMKP